MTITNNTYNFNYRKIDLKDYEYSNLTDIQKSIIIRRTDDKDIDKYVYNDYDIFQDLIKLKDIDKAADLIIKHLNNKSNICICTDLDCDGMSSAYTLEKSLLRVFKHPKDKLFTVINRRKDGNGFNPILVNRIIDLHKEKKIDLMITGDHGSANEEQYKTFKQLENPFDIILTDHHQITVQEYPKSADVVINPQREDSTYDKNISGCTVAFLVMLYTYYKMYNKKDLEVFYPIIPYSAITVISDVMSCKSLLNRFIYKVGINQINKHNDLNFKVYKDILGISYNFNLKDIGIKLAPFINSANRMNSEDIGYSMLSSEEIENCRDNANKLSIINNNKKNIVKNITNDILFKLRDIPTDGGIVFKIPSTASVNGLIAAKIGEYKKIPAICFIDNNQDKLSGSCRSIIQGFNILECIEQIDKENPNVINQYGGHKEACGVNIDSKNFDIFKELFYKYSKKYIDSIDKSSLLIDVDFILKEEEITLDLIENIRSCGPYGKDWREPIILSRLNLSNVLILGSTCKLLFKRKYGGILEGFYQFGNDDLNLNIDNIKSILETNKSYMVFFTIDIVSYLKNLNININIVKIASIV